VGGVPPLWSFCGPKRGGVPPFLALFWAKRGGTPPLFDQKGGYPPFLDLFGPFLGQKGPKRALFGPFLGQKGGVLDPPFCLFLGGFWYKNDPKKGGPTFVFWPKGQNRKKPLFFPWEKVPFFRFMHPPPSKFPKFSKRGGYPPLLTLFWVKKGGVPPLFRQKGGGTPFFGPFWPFFGSKRAKKGPFWPFFGPKRGGFGPPFLPVSGGFLVQKRPKKGGGQLSFFGPKAKIEKNH